MWQSAGIAPAICYGRIQTHASHVLPNAALSLSYITSLIAFCAHTNYFLACHCPRRDYHMLAEIIRRSRRTCKIRNREHVIPSGEPLRDDIHDILSANILGGTHRLILLGWPLLIPNIYANFTTKTARFSRRLVAHFTQFSDTGLNLDPRPPVYRPLRSLEDIEEIQGFCCKIREDVGQEEGGLSFPSQYQ